jgi:hypothetical protein
MSMSMQVLLGLRTGLSTRRNAAVPVGTACVQGVEVGK